MKKRRDKGQTQTYLVAIFRASRRTITTTDEARAGRETSRPALMK
jgi:hypothetical protein